MDQTSPEHDPTDPGDASPDRTVLRTFGPNELGRDFVIGDLHGALPVFENLLQGLQFDEARDRMFSVGDLVDRGVDSLGCLGLLRRPWFHATLGNHEQMMYEAFYGGYTGQYWFQNGGTWGLETWHVWRAEQQVRNGTRESAPVRSDADADLLDLLETVGELPFLITINHRSGKKFHIIHAEFPPGFNVTDDMLSSPGKVLKLAQRQTDDGGDFLMWGRHQYGRFFRMDLSNRDKVLRSIRLSGAFNRSNDRLSHVISGHTILRRPMTIVGQTNIDTCAYDSMFGRHPPSWCGLTCVDLDAWTFYLATESTFGTVEPVVVTKEDLLSDEGRPADL